MSIPVVEFVGHTTVDGSVGFDINNVTDLVVLHVGRQTNVAMLTEISGEEVARTRAETVRVRHVVFLSLIYPSRRRCC